MTCALKANVHSYGSSQEEHVIYRGSSSQEDHVICNSDLDFAAGRDLSLVGDRLGRLIKGCPSRKAESARVGRVDGPSLQPPGLYLKKSVHTTVEAGNPEI